MSAEAIQARFPFIYQECLKVGLDISREPVPVVPAAHYFCGGVLVDEWSRSSIENLYAVGEISCTGVHVQVRHISVRRLIQHASDREGVPVKVLDREPTPSREMVGHLFRQHRAQQLCAGD